MRKTFKFNDTNYYKSDDPFMYVTENKKIESYQDYDEDEHIIRELENKTLSSVAYHPTKGYVTFCECTQKKYSLSMEELYKLVMSHWYADMQKAREEDAD